MLNLIITFALLAAAAYVGFLFVRAYTTTTGSWWQRTLSAGKSSATIVWAQLLIMSTGFINAFADIMSQVDPSAADQIKSVLQPQYVAAFTVLILLGTIAARLRTLKE